MDLQALKHEYDKNLETHRHWTALQLAQLSVFVAIMSGALIFLLGDRAPKGNLLLIGKLGAVVLSGCLWLVQESHMYVVAHCLKRSAQLEKELGYQIFSVLPGMPQYKWAPAKWALRLIYACFFVFWTYVLVSALTEARAVPN